MSEQNRYMRLRRELARDGYALSKSRQTKWTLDDQGEYMVVDTSINGVVLGSRWDVDLDEAEAWMRG